MTKTITVVVGHCLKDDHYSTILSDDNVRNKQYCISEIRSVLENKVNYSLASARTKAYWKSWFREIWDAVLKNIQQYIGTNTICKNDISIALNTFLKKCDDDWLRYVLDLFSTEFNNLCMFFDTISITIRFESKNLHKLHVNEVAESSWNATKPPRGG